MNRREFTKALGLAPVALMTVKAAMAKKAKDVDQMTDKVATKVADFITCILGNIPHTQGKFYFSEPSSDNTAILSEMKKGGTLTLRFCDLKLNRGRRTISYIISEVKKQTDIYYHA